MKTRRAHQRGAAMVEAIVVMGVMLVFLGMNVWAYRAYGGKIDQMSSTRRDALYFASHACETANEADPDSYTDKALAGTRSSGGRADATFGDVVFSIVDSMRGRERDTPDFVATARSVKEPTEVRGTAVTRVGSNGATRSLLTARIGTKSAVGCNEKFYGENYLALLRLGRDALVELFRM